VTGGDGLLEQAVAADASGGGDDGEFHFPSCE